MEWQRMSTPTILIADDDPNIVALLKYFLRPLEAEFLTARDGEEALAIAREREPDVILLDVVMPKKSGWEVCQALNAVHRTAHIPIILITGKGEVKDRLTGLQVGADDYLVKPFQRHQVLRRVSAVLDQKASRSPGDIADPASALQGFLSDRTTSLPTVASVIPRVKECLIQRGTLGVIHIDVEQLEAVEDEYGWAFFEEFLRTVGEVAKKEAESGANGAIVAVDRVASSSFFVFADSHDEGSDGGEPGFEHLARRLHQKLVEAVKARFPHMQSGQIGFFVGTATADYRPQIRLERQIYGAMREAADAVRTAEQQRKRELGRELRDIIRRKRVTTVFQPIVNASDTTVFGYEILTRGPKKSSFRNADMLFSFAREMRLAWDLEALALETFLERFRREDLGERKFLINLEAEMFSMADQRFREMLAFFAERRGRFVLELTERAAIEDYDAFRILLDEFRGSGIEIAIDDAGSGYASLEAIASLAPDYLKITKGLVSTIAIEPIKQDLVSMLVELAQKIGARTIAEGIETEEEYAWCRRLGVDLLQGYYLAIPEEKFAETIALGERTPYEAPN
jgi:EAL domain-containing protein (putative c-di-GMP-specific phosphodiesterase class I)/CheY-like chemotaxis protein